jgi:DNA-binding transcriptional ArsR family regulator
MPNTSFSRDRNAVSRSGAFALPLVEGRPGIDLQAKAQEAASLLKALANPDRLLLLCQMVDAERSVAELGELTGIAQPSLSQQLGVLRGERLVSTRREGKHVHYSVDSPAALVVLHTLYGLFCEPESPPAGRRSVTASNRTRKVAA